MSGFGHVTRCLDLVFKPLVLPTTDRNLFSPVPNLDPVMIVMAGFLRISPAPPVLGFSSRPTWHLFMRFKSSKLWRQALAMLNGPSAELNEIVSLSTWRTGRDRIDIRLPGPQWMMMVVQMMRFVTDYQVFLAFYPVTIRLQALFKNTDLLVDLTVTGHFQTPTVLRVGLPGVKSVRVQRSAGPGGLGRSPLGGCGSHMRTKPIQRKLQVAWKHDCKPLTPHPILFTFSSSSSLQFAAFF